jgi:hypothetical protein
MLAAVVGASATPSLVVASSASADSRGSAAPAEGVERRSACSPGKHLKRRAAVAGRERRPDQRRVPEARPVNGGLAGDRLPAPRHPCREHGRGLAASLPLVAARVSSRLGSARRDDSGPSRRAHRHEAGAQVIPQARSAALVTPWSSRRDRTSLGAEDDLAEQRAICGGAACDSAGRGPNRGARRGLVCTAPGEKATAEDPDARKRRHRPRSPACAKPRRPERSTRRGCRSSRQPGRRPGARTARPLRAARSVCPPRAAPSTVPNSGASAPPPAGASGA